MSFQAQSQTLSELFADGRLFSVAPYQRRYEWAAKEMEALVDDLLQRFRDSERKPDVGHFLSCLVFQKPHPSRLDDTVSPANEDRLDVVDGQQRLTSISILVAVVRDLIRQPAKKAELDRFLTRPANASDPAAKRLKLHRGDEEYFEANIADMGATMTDPKEQQEDSHERMRLNVSRARELLSGLSQDELVRFAVFVTEVRHVICVVLEPYVDAFEIFETINNRGRPISSEDVLRYTLVEYATKDPAVRTALLSKWDDIEADLGRSAMSIFIGQWRQKLLQGRKSNRSLVRDILNAFKAPADAHAFLASELGDVAQSFSRIVNADLSLPDGPDKSRAEKALASMALTADGVEEWIAVAQHLLLRHANDAPRLARSLVALDQLVWSFYLRSNDKGINGERKERFSQLLRHLEVNGSLDPGASPLALQRHEKDKVRDLLAGRIDARWAPLRSLLTRIEMALKPENVTLARASVTVEHVLPMTATAKAWRDAFGGETGCRQYAHKLGNLAAASEGLNGRLSNKIFSTKKKLILHSREADAFATLAFVAAQTNWTPKIVDRRTKELVELLVREFGL